MGIGGCPHTIALCRATHTIGVIGIRLRCAYPPTLHKNGVSSQPIPCGSSACNFFFNLCLQSALWVFFPTRSLFVCLRRGEYYLRTPALLPPLIRARVRAQVHGRQVWCPDRGGGGGGENVLGRNLLLSAARRIQKRNQVGLFHVFCWQKKNSNKSGAKHDYSGKSLFTSFCRWMDLGFFNSPPDNLAALHLPCEAGGEGLKRRSSEGRKGKEVTSFFFNFQRWVAFGKEKDPIIGT